MLGPRKQDPAPRDQHGVILLAIEDVSEERAGARREASAIGN